MRARAEHRTSYIHKHTFLCVISSSFSTHIAGLVRDGNVGIFVESETLLDLTECVALTDGCAAAIASKNLVAIRLSHCSRLTDTALEVRLSVLCVC